ncbi:MAG: RNA methyltransferase substrate-binding domain-containing protein, partial [Dialister sp.]|nr:RNA methyltransferase substrate-binding domain-containing protein [Dialister sp.]
MYDRKHGRNKKEPGGVKRERQDRKMKSRRSVFSGRETADREDFLIGGRNSVAESLRAGQVKKIFVKAGKKDGRLEELVHQAAESGIAVTEVEEDALSEMTGGIRHQGIAAALRPYEYADLDTVLAEIKEENPILILLDGIEDVRNLGAIVRTAECGGVAAVLLPKHKSSPVTAAAMKTAAGAFAYLPVCQTGNIRQTLESLKKRGFWV